MYGEQPSQDHAEGLSRLADVDKHDRTPSPKVSLTGKVAASLTPFAGPSFS